MKGVSCRSRAQRQPGRTESWPVLSRRYSQKESDAPAKAGDPGSVDGSARTRRLFPQSALHRPVLGPVESGNIRFDRHPRRRRISRAPLRGDIGDIPDLGAIVRAQLAQHHGGKARIARQPYAHFDIPIRHEPGERFDRCRRIPGNVSTDLMVTLPRQPRKHRRGCRAIGGDEPPQGQRFVRRQAIQRGRRRCRVARNRLPHGPVRIPGKPFQHLCRRGGVAGDHESLRAIHRTTVTACRECHTNPTTTLAPERETGARLGVTGWRHGRTGALRSRHDHR